MTSYHLYFHGGCFDGAMSAALMSHFLAEQGESIASLNACRYQSDFAAIWEGFVFKKPFAVLDFRYHPQADWWFDHHGTTFLKADWQANFKSDRQRYLDPDYPSCFGMTINFLKKHYHYQPSAILQELEPWADKIDSADYQSAEEAVSIKSWVQELMLLNSNYDLIDPDGYADLQKKIIENVASGEIKGLLSGPYHSAVDQLKSRLWRSREVYKKEAVIKEKVSFMDQTVEEILFDNFLGYSLFPQLPYSASISKSTTDFHLHIGRNPWFRPASTLHIGELMKKYGGGGHEGVGGAEVKTKEEALRIIQELIDYLNQHG